MASRFRMTRESARMGWEHDGSYWLELCPRCPLASQACLVRRSAFRHILAIVPPSIQRCSRGLETSLLLVIRVSNDCPPERLPLLQLASSSDSHDAISLLKQLRPQMQARRPYWIELVLSHPHVEDSLTTTSLSSRGSECWPTLFAEAASQISTIMALRSFAQSCRLVATKSSMMIPVGLHHHYRPDIIVYFWQTQPLWSFGMNNRAVPNQTQKM